MEQTIVRVDKTLIRQVKNKYPGFSFNRALKMALLSADIIDIGDIEDPALAEAKVYIDMRLRAAERIIHERLEKIEDALKYG